jgi:hypothetical protein
LYEESTSGEYVGRHVASKVEAATHTLREAGFTLTRSRTGSRRLVTIRRA